MLTAISLRHELSHTEYRYSIQALYWNFESFLKCSENYSVFFQCVIVYLFLSSCLDGDTCSLNALVCVVFVCQCVCLCVCLSVCQCVCLSVCLSVSGYVYQCICLSVCVDADESRDWVYTHGRSIALSVALKEAAGRLVTSPSLSPRVKQALVSFTAADRVSFTTIIIIIIIISVYLSSWHTQLKLQWVTVITVCH